MLLLCVTCTCSCIQTDGGIYASLLQDPKYAMGSLFSVNRAIDRKWTFPPERELTQWADGKRILDFKDKLMVRVPVVKLNVATRLDYVQ